uniref:Protein FAM76A n=1 Tax=Ditylenchus dipsaci TaxID=166011 RepID=A0A915DWY4_9BILA
MMKTCCHCRKDLALNSASVACEKCIKNGQKYGKPTICKYCQLPAAFLDQKCVHCSYSERKHGLPVACSKCKLRCAFPKHPSLKDKHILCRLCFQQDSVSKVNSSKMPSGSETSFLKRPNPESHHSSTSTKKSRESVENIETNMYAEHILTVQQLKDQILELSRCVGMKEKIMQEKDQKIAQLNAELLRLGKDHRIKVSQLQKQNTEMTEPLREQVKILSKQIIQLQKGQKNSFQQAIL